MSNRLLLRLPMLELEATLTRRPIDIGVSWSTVRAAWQRYRSRQRISELDSHMLKDIGVSFADAEHEANKPFWRA